MLFQVDSCIIQLRKFLALSQFFELKCKYCHKRLVHHCYPSKGPIASPHSHYFNLRFTTNNSHQSHIRNTFRRVLQCMLQSNRLQGLLILRFSLNFEIDGIQVLIPFSKTDQAGEGRMIYLPKTNNDYCPVKALKDWLGVALIDQGPLFYKINKANNIEKYITKYLPNFPILTKIIKGIIE